MLWPRLLRRFILVTVCVFLALVMLNTATVLPVWIYGLALPVGVLLTALYGWSFRGTERCPTCQGTGKISVRRGGEIEEDVCYSCDGGGRVPSLRS